MNDKPTSSESSELRTAESEKEKPDAPRMKTLLTGGLAIKSGIRAGGGGSGPKVPPAQGE